MDISTITYTDWEGNEHNALDYLLRDGNLSVPCSRWGRNTEECAPVALLLYLVHLDSGADPIVELLDGCMGDVVNDHDHVGATIADSQHVFGDDFDIKDWLDEDDIEQARAYYDRAYCGEPCPF